MATTYESVSSSGETDVLVRLAERLPEIGTPIPIVAGDRGRDVTSNRRRRYR